MTGSTPPSQKPPRPSLSASVISGLFSMLTPAPTTTPTTSRKPATSSPQVRQQTAAPQQQNAAPSANATPVVIGDPLSAPLETKAPQQQPAMRSGYVYKEREERVFRKSLGEQLESAKTPIFCETNDGPSFIDAASAGAFNYARRNPPSYDMRAVRKHRSSVTMLFSGDGPSKERIDYAVVLPKGFDIDGEKRPYDVAIASPEEKMTARQFVDGIAARGAPAIDNTVVVVPLNVDRADAERIGRDVLVNTMYRSFPVTGARYGTLTLPTDPEAWRKQVSASAVTVHQPRTPLVLRDGGWQHVPNTIDHRADYGRVSEASREAFSKIRTSAEAGLYCVASVYSKELGKPLPCGFYLPPGYDARNAERYPVLMLLPGRNNPLEYWATAGGLVETLDQMMRGNAQKMIVVIPNGTDSFYTNTDVFKEKPKGFFVPAEPRPKGFDLDMRAFVLGSLKNAATTFTKGDVGRISIAGISRGGYGAMHLALTGKQPFVAVSAHAPVLPGHVYGDFKGPSSPASEQLFAEAKDDAYAWLSPTNQIIEKPEAMPKHVMLDVGSDDPYCLEDTLRFASVCHEKGIKPEVAVWAHPDEPMVHNWAAWKRTLGPAIAFHQRSFGGRAGVPPDDSIKNVGDAALAGFEQTRNDAIAKMRADAAERTPHLAAISSAFADLMESPASQKIATAFGYDDDFQKNIARTIKNNAFLTTMAARESDVPRHVGEDLAKNVGEWLERADAVFADIRAFSRAVNTQAIDKETFGDLMAVLDRSPKVGAALLRLAVRRPEGLSEVVPGTEMTLLQKIVYDASPSSPRDEENLIRSIEAKEKAPSLVFRSIQAMTGFRSNQ